MIIARHARIDAAAEQIDKLALAALTAELSCYPKAGLVSLRDAGSHTDMDAETFITSIASLRGYFERIAKAGARASDFDTLNRIGRAAEGRMLTATGGVNTHRGAVFSLGLLAASAGYALAHDGLLDAHGICQQVSKLWGADILATRFQCAGTNGAVVRDRFGVPGAREQAAGGFSVLLNHTLPAMRTAVRSGLDANWAGVQAFLSSVAVLDDTNILHRGGSDALAFARRGAESVLAVGGAHTQDGRDQARRLHSEFVGAWVSPGGSADMLALCYFVSDFERLFGA
jgi:triphosphoribosyl-dephospho-CoA synthase